MKQRSNVAAGFRQEVTLTKCEDMKRLQPRNVLGLPNRRHVQQTDIQMHTHTWHEAALATVETAFQGAHKQRNLAEKCCHLCSFS